jgi:hypothetical protein
MSRHLHFCTYFDKRYLGRALALYRSLRRHAKPFKLWVLCLDRETVDVVSGLDLEDVIAVPLEVLERADPELAAVKQARTLVDYYFTCTAAFCAFLFQTHEEIDLLTYLDADVFFFDNPAPIFKELDGRSVAIIAHRFRPEFREYEQFGKFNVGWVSFRRDATGLACAGRWRRQCLDWCHDRVEPGRFADQKYLDDWPELFDAVSVQHKGANCAPWNVAGEQLTRDNGHILISGERLLFFHFHGLREVGRGLYTPNLERYGARLSRVLRNDVYRPYLAELEELKRALPVLGGFSKVADLRLAAQREVDPSAWLARRLASRAGLRLDTRMGILRGRYIAVPGKRRSYAR